MISSEQPKEISEERGDEKANIRRGELEEMEKFICHLLSWSASGDGTNDAHRIIVFSAVFFVFSFFSCELRVQFQRPLVQDSLDWKCKFR